MVDEGDFEWDTPGVIRAPYELSLSDAAELQRRWGAENRIAIIAEQRVGLQIAARDRLHTLTGRPLARPPRRRPLRQRFEDWWCRHAQA